MIDLNKTIDHNQTSIMN